ncbi:hypothetical protein CRG98_043799, partial [Punica granatum]
MDDGGGVKRRSSRSGTNNTPTLRHRPAPVDIGRFSGTNPEAWTFQVERYFEFYKISPDHQLDLASFYLEGAALEWYRWMFRNKQLVDWPHLAEVLVTRFRKKDFEAPEGRLAKLRQHTTVTEYQASFEAISNETMALPGTFLLHCFISGLRLDIKTAVLAHRPTTLEDAITLAHLHEQRLALEKGFIRPSLGRSPPLLPTPSTPPSSVGSTITTPTTLPRKQPVRRLSYAEAQQRREKGLCFYCDEKYTFNHKCASRPKLFLFEDEGGQHSEPVSQTSNDTALAEELQVQEVQALSTISYHALAWSISPTTLRFTGHIHGMPVQ